MSETTPNLGLTTGFTIGSAGWGDPVSENFRVIDTAVGAVAAVAASKIDWGSVLTGFSAGSNSPVVNTDTLFAAIQKLQGQVSARGYGNGNGTVTGVGGTGTVSGITLSGSVTASGNLTLGGTLAVTPANFASQTQNTFLAAPSGSAGAPTFRAILAADIPTLNQNTTGSAASATNAAQLGGVAAASYALKADVHYIGTTSIALNRASAAMALTGITSIDGTAAGAPWSGISSKPTTIGGYGITDLLTQALTGYAVGANTALAAADTILGAFQKVQGQINTKRGYVPNTTATGATLTPDGGNDFYARTAQDVALNFVNPTGTWPDGDGFVARIKDNGSAQGLSFGANYRACGQASLPITTVAGKTMYIPVTWNNAESKFDVFPAQILP